MCLLYVVVVCVCVQYGCAASVLNFQHYCLLQLSSAFLLPVELFKVT